MTTTKTAKKLSVASNTATTINENLVPISGNILAFNENVLRAISVYSAVTMFSQPQFTGQVTPTNILGLADIMFRYMQGQVNVTQPLDTETTAPVFG